MASPISAGEVYAVAKFALDLFKACKASKGEFKQIGKEVFAMRTIIELAHLDCENPQSILNVTDTKDKSNRKALSIHIRNCKQALQDVEACLKRYAAMTIIDKLNWAWSGHDEVKALESNLSSFATQLNGFVAGLTLKGMGAVYHGIGRIEEALEKAEGNDTLAVKEVMQKFNESAMTPKCTERYKSIISDYAKEVSQSTSFAPPRTQTPDPGRGRKGSQSTLSVPVDNRPKSSDTHKGIGHPESKDSPIMTKSKVRRKTNHTLECWLIQIKSGQLSLLTWEFSEKENQNRGQWKLEEMAQQFRGCKKSKLSNDHDLVNWVLKDRRKAEEDPEYTWHPYAAKKEEKGSLALNLGVEEQAMVIIRRKLTNKAQKKADGKANVAQTLKINKAKKQATELKAKQIAAKQSKDGRTKQSKTDEVLAKKQEQIKQLKSENAKLKAQQKKAVTIGTAPNKIKTPDEDKVKQAKFIATKASKVGEIANESKKKPKEAEKQSIPGQTKCWSGSNCNKQNCPYVHPILPDCWNGSKCTKPGCPYRHSETVSA